MPPEPSDVSGVPTNEGPSGGVGVKSMQGRSPVSGSKRSRTLLAAGVLPLVLASAPSASAVDPVFSSPSAAPRANSAALAAGKVKYYKDGDYLYKAVNFLNGGSKVRVVWTGDGPGACFVGVRSGTGPYRGYERNLAGGSTRRTYTWSQVTSGRRISPPNWLKQTARKVWKQSGCNW